MNHPPSPAAEQLSALADGHLQGPELQQALSACEQDADLLASWRDFHLIGEVLRGAPAAAHAEEARFLARLRPALQQELASSMPAPAAAQVMTHAVHTEAANEPRFRWRWAAGFASFALVVGVAWTLAGGSLEEEGALAAGESTVLIVGSQGVVIRDAALEELMEAHREQSGASVLPMPSGFLRNALFEAAPAAQR